MSPRFKGGQDWTKHFSWIVASALKNRQKQLRASGLAVTECDVSLHHFVISGLIS